MLSDFPAAKKEIKKVVDEMLRKQVKRGAPMLSLIGRKTLHEGDKTGVIHEDGRHVIRELTHVQSEFSVSKQEIETMKPEDFLQKVSTAAEDMAGQIERNIFQTIDESIKESGNIIPGNPPLGPDSILQALETISINFEHDDREKPVMPTIVAAPGAAEHLRELEGKQSKEDKEIFLQKENEILDKKYIEHMNDIRSRRIID